MKIFFSFIFLCIAINHLFATDSLLVYSPDKKITLTVFYKRTNQSNGLYLLPDW